MASLARENRTFFNIEDDTWTTIALWVLLCFNGYTNTINKVVNLFLGKTTAVDTVILTIVFAVLILLGTFAALKKMQKKEFALMSVILILWFLNFMLNENAREVLKHCYFRSVFLEGFCGIICIANYSSWNKFQKIGKVFVTIGIITFIIHIALIVLEQIEEQYMAFSYNNLVFVIAAYWLAIHRKSILMWVFGAVGTIGIIIVGCRGALLCIAVYVLLEFLLNKRIHTMMKVAFFLVVVIGFYNIEPIMLKIDTTLSKYGYQSRTVEKYFEGTLEDDSGRGEHIDTAIEIIEEHPVFGCGMAGSTYHLYLKTFNMEPVSYQRVYSHNLIIDIYLEFGLFFGTLIILYLVWQIIGAYVKNRNKDILCVVFMFFSLCIPKLMVSSVYLEEPTFFMLLGLLLNANARKTEEQPQGNGGSV